jgi:hypothetical protein
MSNIQATGCSANGARTSPDVSFGILVGIAALALRRRKRA